MADVKEMTDHENLINPILCLRLILSEKPVKCLRIFLWYKQKGI